jgi:hypothetical protein
MICNWYASSCWTWYQEKRRPCWLIPIPVPGGAVSSFFFQIESQLCSGLKSQGLKECPSPHKSSLSITLKQYISVVNPFFLQGWVIGMWIESFAWSIDEPKGVCI